MSSIVTAKGQARMQLAYTLGSWDEPNPGAWLGELILRDGRDPYFLAAALSSVTKKNLADVVTVVGNAITQMPALRRPSEEMVDKLFRLCVHMDDRKSLASLLNRITVPDTIMTFSYTALAGLLDALDSRNLTLAQLAEAEPELKVALKEVNKLFDSARRSVSHSQIEKVTRLAALRLLGRDPNHRHEDFKTLAGLLAPQTAADVQTAAVAALGRLRDPAVPALLLHGWKSHAPTLRNQVLDVLLPREDGLKAVLGALEKKHVVAADIDAARRQRLLTHKTFEVRDRVAKLFADAANPDRQKAIDSYRAVLTLKGDAGRGKQLFTKHCAACHKFEGQGNDVGPDIGSVGDKSPEAMLIAILDPNRAVEARYLNYVAETKNGLTLSGVLLNETGTSITLVGADGKPQQVLRTELEALASTGKSAMPEGLEKDVNPQDMADILSYVRAGTPTLRRKEFEGNKPILIKPEYDRSLHLKASNCEIYGSTLVLEKQHGNLGWWQSADDHAVWTVQIERAGRYAIHLDWACDDKTAGNSFVLQAGTNTFTARVEGTGGWDTYRQEKIGTIVLAEGQQRVTLRAHGKLKGALLDLKGIRLVFAGGN